MRPEFGLELPRPAETGSDNGSCDNPPAHSGRSPDAAPDATLIARRRGPRTGLTEDFPRIVLSMRNNNDGRSLPASHRDGQHRSGILFPHPSPDWDRWIRNQADFLGTDDPEPPHPLQDYPRAPQVGGRDFRGDFRAIGRQAFGRAATVAPYLQLNPPNCYAALLLDVDDWRRAQNAIASASVPLPTWQARDRNTGRGHMGYALAEPVHANRTSSLPALHYLAAIENTLQRVMGADPAFAQRALTRNPWRPSLFQKNTWHPRTFALRELIPLCGLLPGPAPAPPRPA